MKKLVLVFVALVSSMGVFAQGSNNSQVEDQLALKRLVDTFSNLADVKDVDSQILLFTEDAEVITISFPPPGA